MEKLKLKLNLKTLKVETFETNSTKTKKGTVIGDAARVSMPMMGGCGNSLNQLTCIQETCVAEGSCDTTCLDLQCESGEPYICHPPF